MVTLLVQQNFFLGLLNGPLLNLYFYFTGEANIKKSSRNMLACWLIEVLHFFKTSQVITQFYIFNIF